MSQPWLLVGDALAVAGALALTLSVVGLVRIPDLNARIHVASKALVLGALLLLAATVGTADPAIMGRATLVGAFLLVTGSVGAHALARAAWRRGDPTRRPSGTAPASRP